MFIHRSMALVGSRSLCLFMLVGTLLGFSSGCSAILFRIKGVPAREIPDTLRPLTRNHRVPIDYRFLGQNPPPFYRVDGGDVLGVAVDGILPFSPPLAPPTPLPVNFPDSNDQMPPSTGFPVVVQQDGTIHLPRISPLSVRQMTIEEIRQSIAQAYRIAKVITEENFFPIVSLIKSRTYSVAVIRQDLGMGSQSIQLDAYRNDVLHALLKSGGLPGKNAKDQVSILRYSSPNMIAPTMRNSNFLAPISQAEEWGSWNAAQVIPLTMSVSTNVYLLPNDAILNDGDILYIESREDEVFYTAGILPAGQHLLPRDYDIDVFEAMSIAGYSYGSGSSGGNLVGITGVAPTQLFVFRKCPDGHQTPIKVDLEKAISDPLERLIVQAGDKLLLRYTPKEEIANFSIFSIFTFGFQQLFRSNR